MQLHSGGLLVGQALEGALNHVLGMPIGQLGTGLDDAPACPLGQDAALGSHVPGHREGQPLHACRHSEGDTASLLVKAVNMMPLQGPVKMP